MSRTSTKGGGGRKLLCVFVNDENRVPLDGYVPWRQKMKKTLLISGVLLALAASTAMAGGVNMSWTACGASGAANRTFLCNNNTGAGTTSSAPAGENILVVSYQPNFGVPDMAGNDVRIDLQSADATTLNQWWQLFNAGSCRSSQPSVDVAGFQGTCTNFWAGQAAGGGGVGSYTINGNKAALLIAWATPEAGPVDNLTEYYSVNVRITDTKTVGSPSCTGCLTGVCLVCNVVSLSYGPSAALVQKIETPLVRNFVTWQGGAIAAPGCPAAVPTQNRTWGQVKSLYR